MTAGAKKENSFDENGVSEGHGGLLWFAVMGAFLGPFAHLAFDDARVDAITSWFQHRLLQFH